MRKSDINKLALKKYPVKIESYMEGTVDVNEDCRNAFIEGLVLSEEKHERAIYATMDKHSGWFDGLMEKYKALESENENALFTVEELRRDLLASSKIILNLLDYLDESGNPKAIEKDILELINEAKNRVLTNRKYF